MGVVFAVRMAALRPSPRISGLT